MGRRCSTSDCHTRVGPPQHFCLPCRLSMGELPKMRLRRANLAVYAGQHLLTCSNGHPHIVGLAQINVIAGTRCPWCPALIGAATRNGAAA
jgi:hypothetical protein